MALSRRSGRSRFTLALLILTSVTVLTLDFRGSSAIKSLRSGVATVFSPVRDRADGVFSPVADAWNGLFHYDEVRSENDQLRAEIEQLQGQVAQGDDVRRAFDDLTDAQGITQFTDLPSVTAQVIAGPLTNFEHTVEIGRGTNHGIKVGMPVAIGAGLVGRIAEVHSDRSVIKLLTDPGIVVGVRLATSGETGLLHGQGDGRALVIDAGIDPKSQVPENSVVLTSGEDRATFPGGIPVGNVTKSELSAAQLTQILTVTPLADLERLTFVKVLLWEPPK